MIKVQQSIQVYELDDKEISPTPSKELLIGVDSHWNRREFIVLVVGEHRYTVAGDDLRAAVKNAQNTSRY